MLKIKAFRGRDNKIWLNFNLEFSFLYEGFRDVLDKFSMFCQEEEKDEYITQRFVELRNRFKEDGRDSDRLLFALLYMYGAIHLVDAAVDYLGGFDKLGSIKASDLKDILDNRFQEFMGDVLDRSFVMLVLALFAMTDKEITLEIDGQDEFKN
jgi:hypothetical protein